MTGLLPGTRGACPTNQTVQLLWGSRPGCQMRAEVQNPSSSFESCDKKTPPGWAGFIPNS